MGLITEIEVPIVETVKPVKKLKAAFGGLRYATVFDDKVFAVFGTRERADEYNVKHVGGYVLDIVTGEKVRHG